MRSRFAARTGLALLGLAEVAAASIALLALLMPASAQIDDRFPFLEDRRRRYQQNQPYQQPQWGGPFGFEQPRQQPVDSSRAPPPRRADATPATKIMVFGDSMADWLAFGLEEAFADTPEIGVLRKHRTSSGLIRVEVRGESYDWPNAARDLLNAEKPDYIVMIIGVADRRGIREAIRQQPPRTPAGQKQQPAQQPQTPAQPAPAAQAPAQQQAAAPPAAAPAKPPDAEASPQGPAQDAAPDSDQSNIIAPETAIAGTVVHEFRSEKWGELYSRRVDEMIGVLKSRGVPVFWVGLPSIRGSRATSEMVYLNDLYRGRAEKAGITYIDIWDGFVDEANTYNNYGPDLEGQTRRLRSGDGTHFTRAGARKLAHYAEREIRRMMASVTPVATPLPQEPEPDTKTPPTAAAPGLPPRPAASPIMSLTAPKGAGDALLGATPVRNTAADSVVTRVLVKGEPLEAPAGRADDFTWPRRDIVTATGVLPPDPVEPPEPAVAGSGGTSAPAAAAVVAAPKQGAPRPRREAQQQQPQTGGWGWFGRPQPYETRPQPQQRGFFGGWFGGRGW
jgi:hypothetical protein